MEEGTSAFKMLTDKPIGKRSLGRPMHRWEENIITYLTGMLIRNWFQLRIGIIGEPL